MWPIGLWRLIVFGLTVLHLLTCNIIWSTNSLRRAIGSARADQLRRADTQIKSHRSIKTVIYDPLPTFSLFSPLSLPLSFFTSAHNILTKSFFDGGISHDSRKMAARQGRERNREGQKEAEMETEELIKLIHLVGCEGRECQAEKISHSSFLNTLSESYQVTGCTWEPLRIKTDFSIITLSLSRGMWFVQASLWAKLWSSSPPWLGRG